MPFWEIIDDVWDNKLHEIACGLLCYIVRMAKAKRVQDLVSMHVDAYREAKGSFGGRRARSRRSTISSDIWWSRYEGDYPELQRLAVRALYCVAIILSKGRNLTF